LIYLTGYFFFVQVLKVRIEGEMNWLTIEGGGEERRMEEGGRTKSSSLKSRKQTKGCTTLVPLHEIHSAQIRASLSVSCEIMDCTHAFNVVRSR
jgi:hypothetical protein